MTAAPADDKPAAVKHVIHNAFDWPNPAQLTIANAQRIGLVKGVLAVEGTTGRGEPYTDHDIIQGAGAMRAAAMTGHAVVSVDHIYNTLPAVYTEKYKAPQDGYPPGGIIIDAQAVKNEDGKMQIEAIMAVEQWIYNAISAGQVKGNSVENFVRGKKNCNDDGSGCEYQGHAYLRNTIVLEGVPNIEGTWVEPVTEQDIPNILKPTAVNNTAMLPPISKMIQDRLTDKIVKNSLADYMNDDDTWKNGADSVKSFLTEIKNIGDDTAGEMSSYIAEHPDIMTRDQLDHMSDVDLTGWWQHGPQRVIKLENENKVMQEKIKNLEGDDDKPVETPAAEPAATDKPADDDNKPTESKPTAADPPGETEAPKTGDEDMDALVKRLQEHGYKVEKQAEAEPPQTPSHTESISADTPQQPQVIENDLRAAQMKGRIEAFQTILDRTAIPNSMVLKLMDGINDLKKAEERRLADLGKLAI